MAMVKRVFLFILVNFCVMVVVFTLLAVFGVGQYVTPMGLDYGSLAAFCLIWGMGGAFVSLALSRWMAKMMMGVRVIAPNISDPTLSELVQRVHRLSRSAGLGRVPEVGIYDSPEPNAFATGPTRSRALVAVSTGLLQRMRDDEVEGVLGHEIAHIANGDMVTLTLIQGVVNAFVMFLARAVAFAIMNLFRSRDDNGSAGFSHLAYSLTVFVLEILFMILGSLVVAWFSRYREFRADSGGARLAGRDKMVAALRRLQTTLELVDPSMDKPALNAFKISTPKRGGLAYLFSSHPPLAERIERLEMMTSV